MIIAQGETEKGVGMKVACTVQRGPIGLGREVWRACTVQRGPTDLDRGMEGLYCPERAHGLRQRYGGPVLSREGPRT